MYVNEIHKWTFHHLIEQQKNKQRCKSSVKHGSVFRRRLLSYTLEHIHTQNSSPFNSVTKRILTRGERSEMIRTLQFIFVKEGEPIHTP